MRILLTGANGYIGKRLLPVLIDKGHEVFCCVRDKSRFSAENIGCHGSRTIEADFLHEETLHAIPDDIDGAYYLIHPRAVRTQEIHELCARAALNFRSRMESIGVKHVVFISMLAEDSNVSRLHASYLNVEKILGGAGYHLTILRAALVIGSGSAAFEIIRNLVEKSPLMIGPKWLSHKFQPLAIRNLISCLSQSLFNEKSYNQCFNIVGPELITFRDALKQFAKARNLKRIIITLPLKLQGLSAYWLFLICPTSYGLARSFIDILLDRVPLRKNDLGEIMGIEPISFFEAVQMAFIKIEQNFILSSWKDSLSDSNLDTDLSHYIQVPTYGCFRFEKVARVDDPDLVLEKLWSIGGESGWYYANWLWQARGFLDKLFGGVGLKRGRTNQHSINRGDALDFWRVILADKVNRRLLLYAEMKLPGEGWLELRIDENNNFYQIATFRSRGIWGRIYWYAALPFHIFVFNGMVRSIRKISRP